MNDGEQPRDWDAATYDRVADPQAEWAREVIDRLDLKGDETVLDAGCGSGRVTRLLLERVPTVCLFVRPENAAAIRVYESIGMRRTISYRSLIF